MKSFKEYLYEGNEKALLKKYYNLKLKHYNIILGGKHQAEVAASFALQDKLRDIKSNTETMSKKIAYEWLKQDIEDIEAFIKKQGKNKKLN